MRKFYPCGQTVCGERVYYRETDGEAMKLTFEHLRVADLKGLVKGKQA